MVESNIVTVTYGEAPPVVPSTEKIKCPFCEKTFDSYEALFKHLSESHQKELAVIIVAIVVVIALVYWAAKR